VSEPTRASLEHTPIDPSQLSQHETRNIVTPYAFHVSKSLFGTPLARPLKRGIALLVDVALIGLLSQASDVLLALVAAVTFFRAGNRLKQKKRFNLARISLRFITAILVFLIAAKAIEFIGDVIDTPDESQQVRAQLVEEGEFRELKLDNPDDLALIGLTAKYLLETKRVAKNIAYGKCIEPLLCWTQVGEKLARDLASLPLTKDVAEKVLSEYGDAVSVDLTPQQQNQLDVAMTQVYERHYQTVEKELPHTQDTAVQSIDFDKAVEPQKHEVNEPNAETDKKTKTEKAQTFFDTLTEIEGPKTQGNSPPSILAWVQGVAADLGLGFGWAAFYFSIFTAWWTGQTPGKRLLGIRVIKLDGSSLNLWESFGRYGGYGAGFATGLLGFLQIYWDPNRQAIQDKISETLVIDLRKHREPFEQASVSPENVSSEKE
tara:strand:+ start:1656 stop:2951 length:1296 start_codon:yes stop_codon:yes gene_type:complete